MLKTRAKLMCQQMPIVLGASQRDGVLRLKPPSAQKLLPTGAQDEWWRLVPTVPKTNTVLLLLLIPADARDWSQPVPKTSTDEIQRPRLVPAGYS